MPLPVKPVHKLDLHEELFDFKGLNDSGMSGLQLQLLGVTDHDNTKTSARVSERDIQLLEMIDKNVDTITTAAGLALNTRNGDKFCNVPGDISDNELLYLKTAGLLQGYGRNVTLTDRARIALRDHYLNNPVNEFRKARKKNKFNYDEAASVKVASVKTASSSKFKKI
jgi:hypothetical protein